MKPGLTKWRVFGIGLILLLVLVAIFRSPKVEPEKVVEPPEEKELQVLGNLKPKEKSPDDLPDAQTLHFTFNGKSRLATILASAPGMYPPKKIESDATGRISKSFFDVFKGEFEILVRQVDEPGAAFWGPLQGAPKESFELKASHALSLKFLDKEGEPVGGAKVKLGRGGVSLIWIEGLTDEQGLLSFPNIPAGSYVLRAKQGQLRAEKEIVHGMDGVEVLLESRRLYDVKGQVTDDEGRGLPDALIESYGEKDYASDIVRSDLFGNFSLQSSNAEGRLVVRHTKFVTAHARYNVSTENIVKLKKGKQVSVRVSDPTGNPVAGALVSWSQKGNEEIGEAKASQSDGSLTFGGVPDDALFTAFLGGFKSQPSAIQEGRVELALMGEFDLKKRIRFRVTTPTKVKIMSISARQSHAECDIRATSDRDFELSGCPEGEFELVIHTQKGVVKLNQSLTEGTQIQLDSPTLIQVKIEGNAAEKWGRTKMFLVFGGDKIPIQFDLLSGENAQWEGELYPSTYRLVVENARIGEREYTLDTKESEVFSFALKALKTLRFWVIDDHNSPVNNAYIMLWRGTTLVDVASSSGQLPTEFREENVDELSLLVLDAQRGEGGGKIGDFLEKGVVLNTTIGSSNFPKNRIKKEDLKVELGVTFSEKDRGFLIKVEEQSKAEEIGLRNGDFWLMAYLDAGGHVQIIVSRKGEYKVNSFESSRF